MCVPTNRMLERKLLAQRNHFHAPIAHHNTHEIMVYITCMYIVHVLEHCVVARVPFCGHT